MGYAEKTPGPRSLLWVDDDLLTLSPLLWRLKDEGYEVVPVSAPAEAIQVLRERGGSFSAMVIDVAMPLSPEFQPPDALGGQRTGVALARLVRSEFPSLPLIGCTILLEPDIDEWFSRYAAGYISKFEILESPRRLLSVIDRAICSAGAGPKCFIIHGRDEKMLLELKDFLQSSLRFAEPVILRQQASLGRTIIEKFEDLAADVDIVFALLTPDDVAVGPDSSNDEKRRARQNVIFELGYFWGKFQRRRGRVILLYSGALELPSDLSGIVYVNVSDGIEKSGERIRRELVGWI